MEKKSVDEIKHLLKENGYETARIKDLILALNHTNSRLSDIRCRDTFFATCPVDCRMMSCPGGCPSGCPTGRPWRD